VVFGATNNDGTTIFDMTQQCSTSVSPKPFGQFWTGAPSSIVCSTAYPEKLVTAQPKDSTNSVLLVDSRLVG
jgi:hypothetical protein